MPRSAICRILRSGVVQRCLFPWLASASQCAADLSKIARPDQRHWAAADRTTSRSASPFLQRVWQAARCGVAGKESDARTLFDESRALLAEFDRYHRARDRRLDAMCASASWRLTAPLRHLKRAVLAGWSRS